MKMHRIGVLILAASLAAWLPAARPDDSAKESPRLVLQGHSDAVHSVAFSPDSKRVLTGSADKTARLWDADTGHEIRVFQGHTGLVTSVAFSPDGKRVLTASHDETARLWDAETGKEIRAFQGHASGALRCRVAAKRRGSPSHLMNQHFPGGMARARQETGVVLTDRFQLGGYFRHVVEFPNLQGRADGQTVTMDRQPHRLSEAAEVGVDDSSVGAKQDQLASLVGRDQHGDAEMLQDFGESGGVNTPQGRQRIGFGHRGRTIRAGHPFELLASGEW